MARLVTAGAEIYVSSGTLLGSYPEGKAFPTAGTITRDTTTKHSPGLASWQFAFTAGNGVVQLPFTGVLDRVYFWRFFIRIPSGTAPNATVNLCGTNVASHVSLDTSARLVAVNNGAVISSAINDGNWHRVEYKVKHSATQANRLWELKLDGTVLGSGTAQASDATAPTLFQFGINTASITFTMNIDDFALNDDQGTDQNGYPGDGRVLVALPTADNALGTGWTNDQASTTNVFNSVKNTPPAGIADTTTGGGGHQARNATANANSNYDVTLQTYTVAGVGSSDTVKVVIPIVATSAPSATSPKAGTVGVVSNPAITNISLDAAGTSGAFYGGTVAGTFPTGWKWSKGTTTPSPTVTKGTAPVMRITQVTSSTQVAMVTFMGLLMDVQPAANTLTPISVSATVSLGNTLGKIAIHKRAIAASISNALVLKRRPGRVFARSITAGLTLARKAKFFRSLSRSVSNSVTVTRRLKSALSRSITAAPSVVRVKKSPKAISASISSGLLLKRQVSRTITSSVSVARSLQRRVGKKLQISVTVAPAVVRRGFHPRLIASTVSITTAVSRVKKILRPLSNTVTLGLALVRTGKFKRALSRTVTNTLTLQRKIKWTIQRGILLTGSLTKFSGKRISIPRTVTMTNVLARKGGKLLVGSVTTTLILKRRVGFKRSRSVTLLPVISRKLSRVLSRTVTLSLVLKRRPGLKRSMTVSTTLSLSRRYGRLLSRSVALGMALKRRVGRKFSLSVTDALTLKKKLQKNFARSVSLSTSLTKARFNRRTLNLSLTLTSALKRRIGWTLSRPVNFIAHFSFTTTGAVKYVRRVISVSVEAAKSLSATMSAQILGNERFETPAIVEASSDTPEISDGGLTRPKVKEIDSGLS